MAEESVVLDIRPFSPEWAGPCAEIAATAPDPWRPADFENLAAQGGKLCLVALEGGILLGFACFLQVGETADLQLVAVAPAHRRRGIGRRLLTKGLAALKEQGVCRCLLEARLGNEAALELYRALGFQELARRPGMYSHPKEDGILLALALSPNPERQTR